MQLLKNSPGLAYLKDIQMRNYKKSGDIWQIFYSAKN
jgi:hypothetical protein